MYVHFFFAQTEGMYQSIVFWSYLDQFCPSLAPCHSIVLFHSCDHMLFLFSFNFRIFLKLIDLIVLILLNMCSINIFPHLILNEIYSEMSLTPPLLLICVLPSSFIPFVGRQFHCFLIYSSWISFCKNKQGTLCFLTSPLFLHKGSIYYIYCDVLCFFLPKNISCKLFPISS